MRLSRSSPTARPRISSTPTRTGTTLKKKSTHQISSVIVATLRLGPTKTVPNSGEAGKRKAAFVPDRSRGFEKQGEPAAENGRATSDGTTPSYTNSPKRRVVGSGANALPFEVPMTYRAGCRMTPSLGVKTTVELFQASILCTQATWA